MSRSLTAAAVRELLAQHSGVAFLELLTLSHPSMTTVRLVNNTQNVVSRGDTYLAFPFQVELPADVAEQLVAARLTISNVDRRLIDELRSIAEPIAVTLEIVTASAADTVEVGPFVFDMFPVTYDAERITGTLAYEPILDEPFPADSFTPQSFPGLFSRV